MSEIEKNEIPNSPQQDPNPLVRELIYKLEAEKLQHEINALNLAWWKRPAYLALLIPILISLFGFSSALLTGYFSDQRKTLEREVEAMYEQKKALQFALDDIYQLGQTTLSEAAIVTEELKVANERATQKVWKLRKEQVSKRDSIWLNGLEELYEENLSSITVVNEKLKRFENRLSSLPAARFR